MAAAAEATVKGRTATRTFRLGCLRHGGGDDLDQARYAWRSQAAAEKVEPLGG